MRNGAKQVRIFALASALFCGGCAGPVDPAMESTMVDNSSRSGDSRADLTQAYLMTGEARTLDEAEQLTADEMNRQWAAKEKADAEARRQAKIQDALRDAKLDED